MSRKRIVLLVIGSILSLIGLALLAGGSLLGWATATQRDDAGFFTTPNERYTTETAAFTTTDVDLGRPEPVEWWSDRHIVTVRVNVDGAVDAPIFVGIAPSDELESYLTGVPHDELSSIRFHPFDPTYRRDNADGRATPEVPATQDMWVASATGAGELTLTWEPRSGAWSLVVMNADASPGVTADIDAGVRVDYLAQIALGIGLIGLLFIAGGVACIVPAAIEHHDRLGTDQYAPSNEVIQHVEGHASGTPVRLTGHLDAGLSRWRWLVKWFLAIPHFIVLFLLWIAFTVMTIVAFFAILFTGRYPRTIFQFNVGVLRWTWRVAYYCTGVLGTDRYPPFTLQSADYPATLEIAYPEHLSRGLIFVKSWLLAAPHLIIIGILGSTTTVTRADAPWPFSAGGLISILALVAAVTLLFTGRYPNDLHRLLVGLNRWVFRVIAYIALMTDQYPPFRLDQGSDEPSAPLGPAPTVPAQSGVNSSISP